MNRALAARAPSAFRDFATTVVAVLLATGCGNAVSPESDAAVSTTDAKTPTPDASTTTDAAVPDAGETSGVTFRLRYDPLDTTVPQPDAIYVEIACSQMWVHVIDGEGNWIPIDSDCGTCDCATCADSCAVCDCALLIEPIQAGSHRDHAWDGVTHPVRQDDTCGSCSFDSTLPAGTYTARFCWSTSEFGDQVCADETFTYPQASVVEHVVTGQ